MSSNLPTLNASCRYTAFPPISSSRTEHTLCTPIPTHTAWHHNLCLLYMVSALTPFCTPLLPMLSYPQHSLYTFFLFSHLLHFPLEHSTHNHTLHTRVIPSILLYFIPSALLPCTYCPLLYPSHFTPPQTAPCHILHTPLQYIPYALFC